MRTMWIGLTLAACTPQPEEGVFEGPGFDPQTGEALDPDAGERIVAFTYLRTFNAPGPGGTFGDHAQRIGEHLLGPNPPPGFLGVAFRNVGRLRWWTASAWESERAMVDFMYSEPHLAAMRDFEDITAEAKSTHLTLDAAELPVSWTRALDTLAAEPWILGPVEGE